MALPVTRPDRRRSAAARRLWNVGARTVSGVRSAMPTDRRAWAWLLDETVEALPPLPASRDEALGLPAFGRGVELLAATVAGVPLEAYRWDPARGVDVRLPDQPGILTDPDPMTTPWHYRYACTKDLIESGNHVALLGDLDTRTGRAGWLVPLPVDQVGLVTDSARPGWYVFTIAGVMLDPADVLHISAGNRSGEILGQGIIAQYAEQLGGQVAAETWAGKYVSGGGIPPAIIQHPSVAPGDQSKADDLKARWRALIRTGEAMVLPSGATVTPLQSDAERQQLVQARTWNSQLSAMILGIPSTYLGLPGPTMTYTNVESVDVGFIRDTVTRWADPIAGSFTKWLLPAGTEARPKWATRARTDMATQAGVVTQLVAAGVWSVDEGRQAIGYEPMADAPAEGSTPVGVPNLGTEVA